MTCWENKRKKYLDSIHNSCGLSSTFSRQSMEKKVEQPKMKKHGASHHPPAFFIHKNPKKFLSWNLFLFITIGCSTLNYPNNQKKREVKKYE